MKINIRGEKLEITDSMKKYAEEKLEKLDKYFENPNEVQGKVLAKLQGPKQKVEITVPIKNIVLRVEEVGEDFYATIDTALDKLERQIRKNKTKIESRKKKKNADYMYFSFVDEDIKEENTNKIVKRKTIELQPMDEDEAILQMELLNHDFFLFKDSNTNKVSLIYRRNDKDYGIIEEE